MDLLSITGTCVGLLASIAKLSMQITRLLGDVRASRRDMDAVRRELSSLSFCVESLRDDTAGDDTPYPESLKSNLISVLTNCGDVMIEIEALLEKSSSGSLGRRMLWAASTQEEMNKLRSRLEAHKATIEIAPDMASIFLISTVKHDTSKILLNTQAIKEDIAHVPGIKEDTSQLLAKISSLEARLLQTEQLHQGRAHILQRFLDSSTTYAETIVQTSDSDHSDVDEPISSFVDRQVQPLNATQYEDMDTSEDIWGEDLQDPEPAALSLMTGRDASREQNPESLQNQKSANKSVEVRGLDEQSETFIEIREPFPKLKIRQQAVEDSPRRLEWNIVEEQHRTTTQLDDPLEESAANVVEEKKCDKFEGIITLSYTARATDELSAVKGDHVMVLGQVTSKEWFYVRLGHNEEEGWIPGPYIAKTESAAPKPNSDQSSLSHPDINVVTALKRLHDTLGNYYMIGRIPRGFSSAQFVAKLEFLVDKGADLEDRNYALLKDVVRCCELEILQYVLHHCGSIGFRWAFKELLTLHDFSRRGWNRYGEVYVRMLDLFIANANGVDLDYLPRSEDQSSSSNLAKLSSVYLAASNGNWCAVPRLIAAGVRSGLDETLYEAVRSCPEDHEMDVIKLLVESGADVNYRGFDFLRDSEGKNVWTAKVGESVLERAARYGEVEIVSYLISQGVDVLAAVYGGWTALKWTKHFESSKLKTAEQKSELREVIAMLKSAEKNQRERQGLRKKWFR